MKRSILMIGLGVAILFLLTHGLYASYLAEPLKDRIAQADVVVLGTMKDIRPGYMSIAYELDKGKRSGRNTYIYDIGHVHIEKGLRGNWHESRITVSFDNPDQKDHPMRHMMISYHEGQRGIWILNRGTGGFFSVGRPDNFLPEDKLSDVETAIAELRDEEKPAPRIIVREKPGDYDPREAVAYVEGKEELTRMIGSNKYDAVGKLVVTNPKELGVGLSVEEEATSPTLQSR